MTQVQVQTSKPLQKTIEEILEVKFGSSKLDNALALIATVAYKYYDTVVLVNALAQDIITARFFETEDKEYAEAEIVLRTGLKLSAWIGIDKKGLPEHSFRIEHLQKCDCYCGER